VLARGEQYGARDRQLLGLHDSSLAMRADPGRPERSQGMRPAGACHD
jgi:hypothetical protein